MWLNENDIIYDVAKKAKQLCDEKMDELRLLFTSDPEGKLGSARNECLGMSKGDLVEALLVEEFIEEFPREFVD